MVKYSSRLKISPLSATFCGGMLGDMMNCLYVIVLVFLEARVPLVVGRIRFFILRLPWGGFSSLFFPPPSDQECDCT